MEKIIPRVVVLTAIQEEYNAVRSFLSDINEFKVRGLLLEKGIFRYNDQLIAEVIIRECGQGNHKAAIETTLICENTDPELILFVGIAGSRKDFLVGDVIIADKVYSYEMGKEAQNEFSARPELVNLDKFLLEIAKQERRKGDWKGLSTVMIDENVKADIGAIASGQKLIEHYSSPIGERITKHYNDAKAVEMEGFGFAEATSYTAASKQIRVGVIRGISDVLSKEPSSNISTSDNRPTNIKEIASNNAATFAYWLLYKYYSTFESNQHDVVSEEIPTKYNDSHFLTFETESCLGSGRNIIGRIDELKTLKSKLDEYSKVIVLNGMGGIGKTTLAKYFIDTFHNHYTSILWINGSEGIEKGLVNFELVHKLKIFNVLEGKSVSDQFTLILGELSQIKPKYNLLVLDNIDKKIERKVQSQLQFSSAWKVLLTSRRKFNGYELFHIGELSDTECVDLFFKYYTKESQNQSTVEIVLQIISSVFRHTLTIELLAKSIQNHREYSISMLWENLQSKGLNSDLSVDIETDYNRIRKTKTTITKCLNFAFTLNKIDSNDYIKSISQYFSVIPPTPIEYSIAKDIFDIKSTEVNKFNNALSFLVERGWLEEESINERSYFYMHPIIQDVIRKKHKLKLNKLSLLLEKLSDLTSLDNYEEDYSKIVLYAPFIESYLALKETADSLSTAKLCHSYSVLLREFYGNLEKSHLYAEKAYLIRKSNPETPNSDLIKSYNSLSITHRRLGDPKNALYYIEEALDNLNKIINKDTSILMDIATFENTKGQIIKRDHPYEAIKSFEHAIEILSQNQIEYPHLETAIYDNIGNTYSVCLDNAEVALPYLIKSIEIGERSNAPYIQNTYNNIAGCYLDLGLLEQAEMYQSKVVRYYESLTDKDTNTHLAIAYKVYSDIFFERFRREKENELLEKALQFQEMSLFIKNNANKNPNTLRSIAISHTAMAKILKEDSSKQDLHKALEYQLGANKLFQRTSDRSIVNGLQIISEIFIKMGNINEAVKSFKSMLLYASQYYGEDYSDKLKINFFKSHSDIYQQFT